MANGPDRRERLSHEIPLGRLGNGTIMPMIVVELAGRGHYITQRAGQFSFSGTELSTEQGETAKVFGLLQGRKIGALIKADKPEWYTSEPSEESGWKDEKLRRIRGMFWNNLAKEIEVLGLPPHMAKISPEQAKGMASSYLNGEPVPDKEEIKGFVSEAIDDAMEEAKRVTVLSWEYPDYNFSLLRRTFKSLSIF